MKTNLYDLIKAGKIPANALKCKLMKTEDIPPAFEPEQNYENPDGSSIIFDTDFLGKQRGKSPIAGPFADATEAGEALF